MARIDLNADLGEGVGDDESLLGTVTSANIATGAHAGGGAVLRRAVAVAAGQGVAIGAHPSYRDRAGFGRASLLHVVRDDPRAARALVQDLAGQVLLVADEAHRRDRVLVHVKAHGALYNEAVADRVAAEVVLAAVLHAGETIGLVPGLMTQPHGHLWNQARAAGVPVLAEGFVDRRYLPTGHLVDRREPGAVLEQLDATVEQALALASGWVGTQGGGHALVAVESLCVHGDTPGAVDAARAVRTALEGAGWQVRAAEVPT